MRAGGSRHATLLALLLLIGAGAACDDAPGRDRDAQLADRRALERGQRMLQQSAACESAGGERAQACRSACDLGHSNSCQVAGALATAPAEAFAYYARACQGGSGLGCEAAARARRDGRGTARDPADADRLDRSARFYLRVHCEQNHARSCLVLARLFTTSRGGPADRGSSKAFLRRACRLGLPEACAAPAPF